MIDKGYRQLIAWQKAMDLVEAVYELDFPSQERFGLESQVRRAVISVPSNIAEGQGRESTNEFSRFLTIAYGSLMEVETQVMIARRLRYISADTENDLLAKSAEVGRLINGLLKMLKQK